MQVFNHHTWPSRDPERSDLVNKAKSKYIPFILLCLKWPFSVIVLFSIVWYSPDTYRIKAKDLVSQHSKCFNTHIIIHNPISTWSQCSWTPTLQRKQRISHFSALQNHKKIAELTIETQYTDKRTFTTVMIPAPDTCPFRWKRLHIFHWASLFYDTS